MCVVAGKYQLHIILLATEYIVNVLLSGKELTFQRFHFHKVSYTCLTVLVYNLLPCLGISSVFKLPAVQLHAGERSETCEELPQSCTLIAIPHAGPTWIAWSTWSKRENWKAWRKGKTLNNFYFYHNDHN